MTTPTTIRDSSHSEARSSEAGAMKDVPSPRSYLTFRSSVFSSEQIQEHNILSDINSISLLFLGIHHCLPSQCKVRLLKSNEK